MMNVPSSFIYCRSVWAFYNLFKYLTDFSSNLLGPRVFVVVVVVVVGGEV